MEKTQKSCRAYLNKMGLKKTIEVFFRMYFLVCTDIAVIATKMKKRKNSRLIRFGKSENSLMYEKRNNNETRNIIFVLFSMN